MLGQRVEADKNRSDFVSWVACVGSIFTFGHDKNWKKWKKARPLICAQILSFIRTGTLPRKAFRWSKSFTRRSGHKILLSLLQILKHTLPQYTAKTRDGPWHTKYIQSHQAQSTLLISSNHVHLSLSLTSFSSSFSLSPLLSHSDVSQA